MKSTPGPWFVGEQCGRNIDINADPPEGKIRVAHINVFGIHEQSRANARLIAAAPDMRRLLEYYADGGMNDPSASADVVALLARIDGE